MTDLNFTLIAGNDTQITANILNLSNDAVPDLVGASAVVTLYNPYTKAPIATKSGSDVSLNTSAGTVTWAFAGTDTGGLEDDYYPYLIVLTLADSTVHTVNNGDDQATTGQILIQNYP